jgi:hypothetical protein
VVVILHFTESCTGLIRYEIKKPSRYRERALILVGVAHRITGVILMVGCSIIKPLCSLCSPGLFDFFTSSGMGLLRFEIKKPSRYRERALILVGVAGLLA